MGSPQYCLWHSAGGGEAERVLPERCSTFHHFGQATMPPSQKGTPFKRKDIAKAFFDLDLSDTIWLPSRDDDGTMCHERVILFDLSLAQQPVSGTRWLLLHCFARFPAEEHLTRARKPNYGNPALPSQGGQDNIRSQIVQGAGQPTRSTVPALLTTGVVHGHILWHHFSSIQVFPLTGQKPLAPYCRSICSIAAGAPLFPSRQRPKHLNSRQM